MSAQLAPQPQRAEQLLTLCLRLTEAVEGDIRALEAGDFGALHTTDPDIARLSALYGREVGAFKANGGVKGAPADLIAKLKKAATRMKTALVRHEKLVECMRHASEGLIETVAREVESTRRRTQPYAATQMPKTRAAASSSAIIYNKVV